MTAGDVRWARQRRLVILRERDRTADRAALCTEYGRDFEFVDDETALTVFREAHEAQRRAGLLHDESGLDLATLRARVLDALAAVAGSSLLIRFDSHGAAGFARFDVDRDEVVALACEHETEGFVVLDPATGWVLEANFIDADRGRVHDLTVSRWAVPGRTWRMATEVERLDRDDELPEANLLVAAWIVAADVDRVITSAREVLRAVATGTHEGGDVRVPDWFAERSDGQGDAWSLDAWLAWMEDDERTWWWWDARALTREKAVVRIEVEGWPTATGAFEWLLRASGAEMIEWM